MLSMHLSSNPFPVKSHLNAEISELGSMSSRNRQIMRDDWIAQKMLFISTLAQLAPVLCQLFVELKLAPLKVPQL